VVEPVVGLRRHHGIDAGVGERERLGDRDDRPRRRKPGPELREHAASGVERGDPVAERDQACGELARAGAELQHVERALAGLGEEPARGLLGIPRTRALVGLRDPVEGPGPAAPGSGSGSRGLRAHGVED
jgi:hypothetical protein